jgi:hypothetical protein|tara:strand:+ start:511 stop:1563 length:1053 start_codon:yes stop_codon:yes gene_type:complete
MAYNGYSGRLFVMPIGKYSDQLFGDITANGYLRPTVSPEIPDSVAISSSFQLKLGISIDSLETPYGDTLSQSQFTVHEVTSKWRGNSLRIDDDIQYGNQIGSFTTGSNSEIIVDLDEQWVDTYKSYFNSNDSSLDSLYVSEFQGLAIVSDQNNSKISFPTASGLRFLLINRPAADDPDTVSVGLNDYGFTLNRTGATNPPTAFPLHSTLEGMSTVSFPDSVLKADFSTSNIVKAEMVFYEAANELASGLPPNHLRLPVQTIQLHPVTSFEPSYEYQFTPPLRSGSKVTDTDYYTVRVTNIVNNIIFGSQEIEELALGIGSIAGTLRSTLIYGATAPEDVRPKLIITSIVD